MKTQQVNLEFIKDIINGYIKGLEQEYYNPNKVYQKYDDSTNMTREEYIYRKQGAQDVLNLIIEFIAETSKLTSK